MCGRFAIIDSPATYAQWFGVDAIPTEALAPNYNVAPTDEVYAIADHNGERQLGTFRWGLIPHFAKDRKAAARHINARAETVAEKPAFRDSFARMRCLIPASGFYEWEQRPEGGSKLPHYIYAAGGRPLGFAGLWASWRDPETGDGVRSCTIITGEPDSVVRPLHDRMPVILAPEDWDQWLSTPADESPTLIDLLRRPHALALRQHPVSTLVNDVRNNLAQLIEPLPPQPDQEPAE